MTRPGGKGVETVARPKLKNAGDNPQSTRERLLDTAGELLAEVGMDRISTNMICERAGSGIAIAT